MNSSQLFALTNVLSRFITFGTPDETNGCDHTLRYTEAWLAEQQIDAEAALGWLQQRGGWCDCSIVVNVFLAEPHTLGEHVPPLPLSAFEAWPREH